MSTFKFNIGQKVLPNLVKSLPAEILAIANKVAARTVDYRYEAATGNIYVLLDPENGSTASFSEDDLFSLDTAEAINADEDEGLVIDVIYFTSGDGSHTCWLTLDEAIETLNIYEPALNTGICPEDLKLISYTSAEKNTATGIFSRVFTVGLDDVDSLVEDCRNYILESQAFDEEFEAETAPPLDAEWFDNATKSEGFGDILARILGSQPKTYEGVQTANGNSTFFHGVNNTTGQ